MATVHIGKADFLKKVWNFEADAKTWKFLGDKPAIVDFYATWCGPCQMLAPVLEELSNEYAGKIDIYKVDVDEEDELAAAFNISSIPTMLFCPKAGEPQMTKGALPKEQIKSAIESLLK